MKGERRRERDVPAEEWCNEAIRMIIASGSGTGFGRWRAARYAAALEDLDDDHMAAAARAWRAMIGGSAVSLGGIARHCRLCQRLRGGDQLPGARDIGFAAGAGEQPVVADAVESLGQDVEQEAPDELVGRRASWCDTAPARRGDNPCSGR